jgi:hypothetical protein
MTSFLPPPVCPVDLATFARIIRVTRLTLRFLTPAFFDAGPSLPGRIRGAWGHALTGLSARGLGEADTVRAMVFEMTGSAQKPFCIAAEEQGENLQISLTLFGVADCHRSICFDSLIAGLTEGDGLAQVNTPGATRRPLRLLGADWTRRDGLDPFPVTGSARLLFRTPFKIGPRDTLGATWSDIWVSAAVRASAMARWSGLDLPPDKSGVRTLARAMRYQADALEPVRWDRWSSRNPGQRKVMMGMTGPLVIDRWPDELTPLLHLGQALHVGASTSFGLGRYDIG